MKIVSTRLEIFLWCWSLVTMLPRLMIRPQIANIHLLAWCLVGHAMLFNKIAGIPRTAKISLSTACISSDLLKTQFFNTNFLVALFLDGRKHGFLLFNVPWSKLYLIYVQIENEVLQCPPAGGWEFIDKSLQSVARVPREHAWGTAR